MSLFRTSFSKLAELIPLKTQSLGTIADRILEKASGQEEANPKWENRAMTEALDNLMDTREEILQLKVYNRLMAIMREEVRGIHHGNQTWICSPEINLIQLSLLQGRRMWRTKTRTKIETEAILGLSYSQDLRKFAPEIVMIRLGIRLTLKIA